MEGIVKVFKAMVGLYPSVWDKLLAFLFFIVLAIVGNKLICGWACPFGALQELLYSFPVLRRIKRRKVPFILSNTLRGGLFVLMLLLLFGIVGGRISSKMTVPLKPIRAYEYKESVKKLGWSGLPPLCLEPLVLIYGVI